MANEEYKVEGYGERSEYDAPYHPSAAFDPAEAFAYAGDPKASAKALAKEGYPLVQIALTPLASDSTVVESPEYEEAAKKDYSPTPVKAVAAPNPAKKSTPAPVKKASSSSAKGQSKK